MSSSKKQLNSRKLLLAKELLEIQEVIARRRLLNPLEFFKHLPLQDRFHESKAKTKGILGGNRSGKTEEVAEYVIRKCLAKPRQRWWAVGETFTDSVEIQQRKVWQLIPKTEIKYGRYDEINGWVNRKVLFKNGSLITFKSYDQKREGFQGQDMDGIWNDEEPPWDIYREQRMRLIDRDGEMLISMTSMKGVTDLVHAIFEDHTVLESQYAPLVKKTLPRIVEKNGMEFFLFWTVENPYVVQSRTEQEVRLMTRQEIMARIYGIPVNITGKIYMKFSKDIHVVPFEAVPLKDCTIYHVLDPHDRKPWAMIWEAIDKTGTSWTFDEYPGPGVDFNEVLFDDKTYDEYAKIIREKEDAIYRLCGKRVFKRILDPNYGNKAVKLAERQGGQSLTTVKKELSRRGLHFKDGIDSIEAGHLKVREKLDWERKGDEIVYQPKTFFTENCTNSINHHSRYSRKDILATDGDVKDKVKLVEKHKDFCDVKRYFWMSNPKHSSQVGSFLQEDHDNRKAY